MPITKTILKKVRQQAVIKLVGDGTATIDLNADLKLADETFKGYANANVNINSVLWSVPDTAPTLIQRNSSNVMILVGNDNWSMTQMLGFSESSNNTANITVTIPGFGGTVYLGLTKSDGYVPPNTQFANIR
jgi:hypothetical protein